MSETLEIAVAQIPVDEGKVDQNLDRIHGVLERCGGTYDLVVFPETCFSGFASLQQVRECAEPLTGPLVSKLSGWARRYDIAVVVGVAEQDGDVLYNTSVLIGPQGLVGSYRKTHLWKSDYGIFRQGDALRTFQWQNWTVGLLICYDIEFPEPARVLAAMGIDLLIVVDGNMAPYEGAHLNAGCARAQENQIYVVIANRVGIGQRDTFRGGSLVASPTGVPLIHLDDQERVAGVTIDRTEVARARAEYCYLRQRRLWLEPLCREIDTGQLVLPSKPSAG